MPRILKPFFVIYNDNKVILCKSPVESSFISTCEKYAEFDTLEELEIFIYENELKFIDIYNENI